MAASVSHERRVARARRHFRLRKRVSGTTARPRLAVKRSSRHISVQLIEPDSRALRKWGSSGIESSETNP